jgi:hypothetical protein
MHTRPFSEYRALLGHQVSVALTDGSRIDDCQLVSATGGRVRQLWLFADGEDLFVAADRVADVWPTAA